MVLPHFWVNSYGPLAFGSGLAPILGRPTWPTGLWQWSYPLFGSTHMVHWRLAGLWQPFWVDPYAPLTFGRVVTTFWLRPQNRLTFGSEWGLKSQSETWWKSVNFFEKNNYSSFKRTHRDEFNASVRLSVACLYQKLWPFEICVARVNFYPLGATRAYDS